jgi:hypothetical protein
MMIPKRTLQTVTLLVVTALLLGAAASAGAGPLAQTGARTLRKPVWGLTLQYPADWQVSDQADSVSILHGSDSGEVAVFVLARDPAYTDPQRDLAELLGDALGKVGAAADNAAFEETGPRSIAGADARSASLAATDAASGLDMTGDLYQLIKDRAGYVVVIAATADSWDASQPELDAIVDSIRLAGAPAPTVTPTPRRPTHRLATPTGRPAAATPTEKKAPVEAADTPTAEVEPAATAPEAASQEAVVPPPAPATSTVQATAAPVATTVAGVAVGATETVTVMLARTAFEIALPVARKWKETAAVYRVSGSHCRAPGAADPGKCESWDVYFADDSASPSATQLVVSVWNGQARNQQTRTRDSDQPVEGLGTNQWQWLDGDKALQAAMDQGAGEFALKIGPVHLYALSLERQRGRTAPVWRVALEGQPKFGDSVDWEADLDAATGKPDHSLDIPAPAGSGGASAAEAVELVKRVAEWKDSFLLSRLIGTGYSNEAGYATGRPGKWTLYFLTSDVTADNFEVSGQTAQFGALELRVPGVEDPLAKGWPDSAEIWGKLSASTEYALFEKLYPDHRVEWKLVGYTWKPYLWQVRLQGDGAALTWSVGAK